MVFDGDDSIHIPSSIEMNSTQRTFSAWINLKLITTDRTIKQYIAWRRGRQFEVRLSYPNLKTRWDGIGDIGVYANAYLKSNQWMHVAFTYDGKAKRAYVDGQLVGELAFSATPTDSTDALYFGARGATYGFVGALDEIRLYNRALSADEITKLYTNEGWDDPDGDGATNPYVAPRAPK